MLVKIYGSAIHGIDAIVITIEVNIDKGIQFFLVGLPDNAVKESHQRIDASLKNNGYKIPGKQIVINMAPADIRKEGSAYDLPIAIGILAASEQIKKEKTGNYIILDNPVAIMTKQDQSGQLQLSMTKYIPYCDNIMINENLILSISTPCEDLIVKYKESVSGLVLPPEKAIQLHPK